MNSHESNFWSAPIAEVLKSLQTNQNGLTQEQVRQQFSSYGLNTLKTKRKTDTLTLLISQFKSPIILILIFAAILSFFLHDHIDSIIILSIVVISGLLGFWQERGGRKYVGFRFDGRCGPAVSGSCGSRSGKIGTGDFHPVWQHGGGHKPDQLARDDGVGPIAARHDGDLRGA